MKKIISFIVCLILVINITLCNVTAYTTEVGQNRLDVVNVTASDNDGNLPEYAVDNIDSTRWSAKDNNDEGQWIVLDLGEEKQIGYLGIAFYNGDKRYTILDIEVSNDSSNWTKLYDKGHSDEATNELIKFDIEDTKARYVKVTGYGYEYFDGSKTGEWVSIVEIHVYSSDEDEMDQMDTLQSEQPDYSINYTEPGLTNPDGSVHKIHKQNKVTGTTYNVTKYGVSKKDTGKDESQLIQEIINNAEYGDEIYFPNGQYNIQKPLILKDGINIRGQSQRGTVFMAMPDENGNYSDSVFQLLGVNNIVLSKFTITSEFTGEYSTDHKINNPDASGPNYPIKIADATVIEDAIQYAKPSYNVTVDNVLIENYQTMGIRVQNSHDVVIENCVFQNATDVGGGGAGYGVSIQGAGNNINRIGYANDSRYNVVRDCTFKGPYLRHGVILQYYTHNNEIYDNTFIQTKLDAIDLHGEDEYLNEIYDNVIKDILTGAGIAAGNTGATHDKSGYGNYIHDNDISNCREGIKIHLGSEDTIIENNKITGSTVDNAKGIFLQNAPGTIVKGNRIVNNKSDNFYSVYISYDSGTNNRGFGSPENIIVEDNLFKNCTNGIYISDGENIIFNNNIYKSIEGDKVTDVRKYEYVGDLLPSEVLDLTNWKLTLPIVDREDGKGAEEILQPELSTYEDAYFFTSKENNAVVFNAPCDAEGKSATTPNSSYPRSELREMTDNGSKKASWSTSEGKHTMIIDQMITSTPVVKPHVVVGQIHDANDDVIMIRLEGNKLFVEAEGDEVGTLDSSYQLGTRFTVKIEAENDVIKVFYNDELKVEYPAEKTGCYFKAGMYTQSNISKTDEFGNHEKAEAYGEVYIYNLEVKHEESIEVIDDTIINIPNTEPTATITTSMDTYIELKDGIATTNSYKDKTQLEVKSSSSESYMRISFIEFDMSLYNGDIYTGQLKLNKKSCDGDTTVSVYATTKEIDENIVWTDVLEESARISNGNIEVKNFITGTSEKQLGATFIGEMTFSADETVKEYTLNVSKIINSEFASDKVTFIILDEDGENVYLKLNSLETDYPAQLEIWNSEVAKVIQVTNASIIENELIKDNNIEKTFTLASNSSDIKVINDALNQLTYDQLVFTNEKIVLPTSIGDVNISWTSSNNSLINDAGEIVENTKEDSDITFTATLTKNNESTTKEFIMVIEK